MSANSERFGTGRTQCRLRQEAYVLGATRIPGSIPRCGVDAEALVCVFHNRSRFESADGRIAQIDGLHWQQWNAGRIVEERYYDGPEAERQADQGIWDGLLELEPVRWARKPGNASGMVHLVAGGVGAGKTTWSMSLEHQYGALRLSVDEMMRSLFFDDGMLSAGYEWSLERIERCEAAALLLAIRASRPGQHVVLDFGFLGRYQRDRVRTKLANEGVPTRLHFMDVPANTHWERTQARNETRGESFAMHVTREMFDFCETLLESPGACEHAGL